MRLDQVLQSQIESVCIFGDPKTGKSTLASKLAEAGFNLVWISIDNGHSILFKLSPAARARVEIVILPDTKDFPVAIGTCLKIATGKKIRICDAHGQVDCSICKRLGESQASWTELELNALGQDTVVVWDTGTQLQLSALNYIIKKECEGSKSKESIQDQIDTFKAGYDEWRTLGTLMSRFLSCIQQARYNNVVIAHTIEAEMEDGKKKLMPLLGTKNFSTNAGGFFGHIIYAQVLNKKHNFFSNSTAINNVVTGSRTDVFIEEMPEPSLVPFFTSIKKAERSYGEKAAAKVLVVEKRQVEGENNASTIQANNEKPTDNTVVEQADKEKEAQKESVSSAGNTVVPKHIPVSTTTVTTGESIKEKLARLRSKLPESKS